MSILVESLLEGGPGEGRTLDPHRVTTDPLQRLEIAQIGPGSLIVQGDFAVLGGEHGVELPRQLGQLGSGEALDRFAHHGAGGLADGAPMTLDRDLVDALTVERQLHCYFVAAQWVDPFGFSIGLSQRLTIAGVAVMVEDYLAIKLVKCHVRF